VYCFHLNQNWRLFAPNVERREGYFVLILEADGETKRYLLPDLLAVEEHESTTRELRDFYRNKYERQYCISVLISKKEKLVSGLVNYCERRLESMYPQGHMEFHLVAVVSDGEKKSVKTVSSGKFRERGQERMARD